MNMDNINEIYKVMEMNNLSTKMNILDISRIGGLTNRNFVVKTIDQVFVVRLPGFETDKIINRSDEGVIVRALEHLKIDAPLVLFDDVSGIKVSKYIEGAETMNAAKLRDKKTVIQVANLMKNLHTEADKVDVLFDINEMLSLYEKAISDSNARTPENYNTIREQALNIIKTSKCDKRVLSHNDPLPENFVLDSDNRLFLVDWEYAGMNNPYWDLADISIEADYTDDLDMILLSTYLEKEPEFEDLREFELNKLSIDLLWSLWGFIRETQESDNSTNDFYQYGIERFDRLVENLRKFTDKYIIEENN